MILQVRNLHFTYRSARNYALQNISFDIAHGSFTGIAGPNGSGKTTLLKLLNALIVPQRGTIHLDGENLFSMRRTDLAKIIASVGQRVPLNFDFTAFQMVMLGRTPHLGFLKWESAHDKSIVEEVMRQTNTLQFADRSLAELSGGEFQRVCISTALASESKILLLDEPTSFLDLKEKLRLSTLLQTLRTSGKTILCSSHDLSFLRENCTHAVLLNRGMQYAFGPMEQIFSPENLKSAFEIDELTNFFKRAI